MKMALSPPGFSDPFGEYPASGTQLAHAAPTIWGVDAEVFGAVVQAILAGLTLVAVGTAIWVAFREGRHREQDRQEELAGQARTISVELERQFGSSMGTFYVVVVQNHGNAQITDIVLQDIRVVFDGKANEPLWSLNDQSTPPVALRSVLPGGGGRWSSQPVHFSFACNEWVFAPRDCGLLHSVVTVSFTDARGIRWRRTGTQQPQRESHAKRS